jgi:hypothetical protein
MRRFIPFSMIQSSVRVRNQPVWRVMNPLLRGLTHENQRPGFSNGTACPSREGRRFCIPRAWPSAGSDRPLVRYSDRGCKWLRSLRSVRPYLTAQMRLLSTSRGRTATTVLHSKGSGVPILSEIGASLVGTRSTAIPSNRGLHDQKAKGVPERWSPHDRAWPSWTSPPALPRPPIGAIICTPRALTAVIRTRSKSSAWATRVLPCAMTAVPILASSLAATRDVSPSSTNTPPSRSASSCKPPLRPERSRTSPDSHSRPIDVGCRLSVPLTSVTASL